MTTFDVTFTRLTTDARLRGTSDTWTETIVVSAKTETEAREAALLRTRYPSRPGIVAIERAHRWSVGPTGEEQTFPSRKAATEYARANGGGYVHDRLTPVPLYEGWKDGQIVERHSSAGHLRMYYDTVKRA